MGVIVYLGFCATILLVLVVSIFIVYWLITPMNYNYVIPVKDDKYSLQTVIIAIIVCVVLGAGIFTGFIFNPNAFGYEKIVMEEAVDAGSEP